MRLRSRGRAGLATAVALCAVLATSGQALAAPSAPSPGASAGPSAEPSPYQRAKGARQVKGGGSSAEGPQLERGVSTDSIGPGEKRYYGVTLDAASNTYLSAVAAPEPGSKVDYSDSLTATLQSTDGTECDESEAKFGSGDLARPLAATVQRLIGKDARCGQAGPYYLVVERKTAPGSDQTVWPLELSLMNEPALKEGAPAPPVAGSWSTTPPTPPTGQPRERRGGTGFNDARALTAGVWRDELRPGETRFYRVPLDWGQQLFPVAEFSSAPSAENTYLSDVLRISVYNPARFTVTSKAASYEGKPKAVQPDALAPVAHANRHQSTSSGEISGMRFAGWYYLAVSLDSETAPLTRGSLGLTLRLTVQDTPGAAAPEYDGDAAAAGFGLTDGDREAARNGEAADEAAHRAAAGAQGRHRVQRRAGADRRRL
ncbi:hypothetical protein, partial [Streptomyces sp. URMC 123]|uniref:hypothetical protein n=1 Tax=Streptomyces sp. URMC 123 TaxID=3423403 RepID=UPI003F1AEB1A